MNGKCYSILPGASCNTTKRRYCAFCRVTGFWGCFDEFNRINPEVLSVVSAQIKAIQLSLQQGKGSVELLGKNLRFVPTVGIFVTMNPGYAGR